MNFSATRPEAKRSPEYCAATVPKAIPLKPRPSNPVPGIPKVRSMLNRMLPPFTIKSVSIELNVSCIPMNHPRNAIRLRVAGAAQTRM